MKIPEERKKYLPERCPVCKGRGLVNWEKDICASCNGSGIIVIDQETGVVVRSSYDQNKEQ